MATPTSSTSGTSSTTAVTTPADSGPRVANQVPFHVCKTIQYCDHHPT